MHEGIKGAPCWSFASELRVSGNETQYVVMLVATQQQRLNHWFRFRQKFHGCGSYMFLQELQIAPLRVPKSHWPGGTTVKRIHQKQLFPREGHKGAQTSKRPVSKHRTMDFAVGPRSVEIL